MIVHNPSVRDAEYTGWVCSLRPFSVYSGRQYGFVRQCGGQSLCVLLDLPQAFVDPRVDYC